MAFFTSLEEIVKAFEELFADKIAKTKIACAVTVLPVAGGRFPGGSWEGQVLGRLNWSKVCNRHQKEGPGKVLGEILGGSEWPKV